MPAQTLLMPLGGLFFVPLRRFVTLHCQARSERVLKRWDDDGPCI